MKYQIGFVNIRLPGWYRAQPLPAGPACSRSRRAQPESRSGAAGGSDSGRLIPRSGRSSGILSDICHTEGFSLAFVLSYLSG
jgi:hypothetical protein